MKSIAAREAKTRFGELLDNAQREPMAIEKHGRRVAVLLSAQEYDELASIKLDRLRAELQVGIDQLDRGEGIEYDESGLRGLAETIKSEGTKKAAAE